MTSRDSAWFRCYPDPDMAREQAEWFRGLAAEDRELAAEARQAEAAAADVRYAQVELRRVL